MSRLVILGLPLFAAMLALLGWAAARITPAVRRSEPLPRRAVAAAAAALVVADAAICLAILVGAGLSHSQAAKQAVPWRCLLVTVVVLGVPALALLLLAARRGWG